MDEEDFETQLKKAKTRRLLMIGGGVLAIGGLAFGAKVVFGPELPPLPKDDVSEVREALPTITSEYPELTKQFAAESLLLLEKERLPKPFLEAFEGIANAGPYGGLMCGSALTEPEVLGALTGVCPGVTDTLANGTTGKSLIEDCELDGKPIPASAAETADTMCVALGLSAWAYLEDKRSETDLEGTLIRMAVVGR